jgi:hypothetical protein
LSAAHRYAMKKGLLTSSVTVLVTIAAFLWPAASLAEEDSEETQSFLDGLNGYVGVSAEGGLFFSDSAQEVGGREEESRGSYRAGLYGGFVYNGFQMELSVSWAPSELRYIPIPSLMAGYRLSIGNGFHYWIMAGFTQFFALSGVKVSPLGFGYQYGNMLFDMEIGSVSVVGGKFDHLSHTFMHFFFSFRFAYWF